MAVVGVVHRLDMREPAKYTRHAPRIDAPMAAVRRWLKVEVLLAECEVLLMIDMARPFQVSG